MRPPELKAPRIAPYEGDSDPTSHLEAFELATLARGHPDGLLCLLFVETLGGQAINWIFSLEEDSISSFEDLRNAFLRRFKILVGSTVSVAQLFHQQQRPDESLRAFLARWLSTVEQCRDLDKRTALQAFKHCLLPGEFSFSLAHHHKFASYDQIMELTATYAEDEEEIWGASRSRPVANQRYQDEGSRPAAVHTVASSTAVWYEKYKHLITPERFRVPKPRSNEEGPWCDYHQHDSHNTADCRTIPQRLERLYRSGRIPHAAEARD